MTVATGYFEDAASSGTGGVWQDTNELDSTYTTRVAYCNESGGSFTDLVLDEVDALADLPDGTLFNSIQVDFDHRVDNAAGTFDVFFAGTVGGVSVTGTVKTTSSTGVTYRSESFGGSKAYWGISGTQKNIFIALRDGTLKFYIEDNTTAGTGDTAYIRNVDVGVNYTEVDTKRAAILTCVP